MSMGSCSFAFTHTPGLQPVTKGYETAQSKRASLACEQGARSQWPSVRIPVVTLVTSSEKSYVGRETPRLPLLGHLNGKKLGYWASSRGLEVEPASLEALVISMAWHDCVSWRVVNTRV